MRDEFLFLFLKKYQKEIGSHPALKESALPQPSGDERKERAMELTKEDLESMLTKNTAAISVYMEILARKVSTLDTYNKGISEIMTDHPDLREKYNQEDARDLRDLLFKLTHEGLNQENLGIVEKKINEMLSAVSSIAEGELPVSDWPGCYWSQYSGFLHGLRELIATEISLYQKSNLAIARKLAELAD